MTKKILAAGAKLTAIEIDEDLYRRLESGLGRKFEGQINLHLGDALAFDFKAAIAAFPDCPPRLAGNLPYNSAAPLIERFVSARKWRLRDITVMVQAEFGKRLMAAAGSAARGRLSVLAECQVFVEPLLELSPEAFSPPPKVASTLLKMTPRLPYAYQPDEVESILKVSRLIFGQRRKMLRKSLQNILPKAKLAALDIDPTARPQDLELAQIAELARAFRQTSAPFV